MKSNLVNKRKSWNSVPPDAMQWEGHNIIQVVALLEECVWNIREHVQTNPECEMVYKTIGMASEMLLSWKINQKNSCGELF